MQRNEHPGFLREAVTVDLRADPLLILQDFMAQDVQVGDPVVDFAVSLRIIFAQFHIPDAMAAVLFK